LLLLSFYNFKFKKKINLEKKKFYKKFIKKNQVNLILNKVYKMFKQYKFLGILPVEHISIILISAVVVIVLALLKGSKKFDSLIGV